jgi:short-subunit dehydrogenase
MGQAAAHKFASLGHPIQLAARNAESLAADLADLELRYGVPVTLHEFDALATDTHTAFVRGLPETPGLAICAVGLLGRQEESERDFESATRVMRSNYEGPASILSVLANHLVANGGGTLVGISSVAGERGRASNYVYGSAKAGFTAFLSGLRNRLAGQGVAVVTVLPGYVATAMLEGMEVPAWLTAQPEDVAEAIARAVQRKHDVIYVRRIWWLIMLVFRLVPERIFKRTRIG